MTGTKVNAAKSLSAINITERFLRTSLDSMNQ